MGTTSDQSAAHASCCAPKFSSKSHRTNLYLGLAVLLGIIAGYLNIPSIFSAATIVSDLFINLLKLVSLPIIFLSVVSTASGMESLDEIKHIGKRVIKYTLLTTIIAASIALLLFVTIQPVRSHLQWQDSSATPVELATHSSGVTSSSPSYLKHLLEVIPSNIVQPFSTNNVIGVLFIAIFLSLAILALPTQNRTVLHTFFSSLYAAIMKMTSFIIRLMPFAIWAFITLFFRDLQNGLEIKSLVLYLTCVLLANVIQAVFILPAFLKWKGLSPIKTARGMLPALSVAFFTKSSSAALPMAMRCAEDNLKVSRKVAGFSLPLCTTINMNACAAFILITVLFVSMSQGMVYSGFEMALWIFIATIAAVGNAGVPMGCYFLSSAFLAAMNVPLNILGVILPFYTLIDMLESAINVWSDSCVTAIVQKEVQDVEEKSRVGEEKFKSTILSTN